MQIGLKCRCYSYRYRLYGNVVYDVTEALGYKTILIDLTGARGDRYETIDVLDCLDSPAVRQRSIALVHLRW